jgi:carbon-monoxide dehydrogenase medium subunit
VILPFTLHKPDSVESASSLLERYGEDAKILAGGSELILLMKLGFANSKHIVDVKAISDLDAVDFDPVTQVLKVGALVAHRTLETSATVREHFPLIAEMERHLANIRIRNVGTLAGNICFAEPHADPGALLLAYGAKVKAKNTKRERTIAAADFFVDYYKTALEPDEILTEIEIPKPEKNSTGAYLRFCPAERPMATAAAIIDWKDGAAQDVRLAMGCVGPTPIAAGEVADALKKKSAEEISATALEIGARAARMCDPLEDMWGSVEYKRQIVKTLVARALAHACQASAALEK